MVDAQRTKTSGTDGRGDMTGQVIHRERLAWDAARVFVRALGSRQVAGWLRLELAHRLGADLATALSESSNRLWSSSRVDAPQVESGIWRARLTDLLADDTTLAVPLQELVAETSSRLDRAADLKVYDPVARANEPRIIDLDRYRP